jgi:hypothetical protein
MSYSESDAIADEGFSYIGQGISDEGTVGVVQLFNPSGSGKLLYLDNVCMAGSLPVVADMRYTKTAIGTLVSDHTGNKSMDGPAPVAQVRQSGSDPVNDYPYNRPHHEFWNPNANDDREYRISPAIRIPQGRGVAICTANGAKCIATFQWREKEDPLGPVYQPAPISDMLNPGNAFDASETTYASSNGDQSSVTIGLDFGSQTTKSSLVVKSPVVRSFCGAEPPRTINYVVSVSSDATNWTQAAAGQFTDSSGSSQSTLTVSFGSTQFRAIKITLSDGVASWRVSNLSIG